MEYDITKDLKDFESKRKGSGSKIQNQKPQMRKRSAKEIELEQRAFDLKVYGPGAERYFRRALPGERD